jgi:glycerophosphoryl diester phosphodiesterase
MKMSVDGSEFFVMHDSDEYRACETLVQQETPLEMAVSNLIDFYGMSDEEARSYYLEATQKNRIGELGSQVPTSEELEAEPSLDRMLNLKDPKVLKGLGKLAAQALKEQQAEAASTKPSDKTVLSLFKPSMSKEEIKKNLVAGLKRSGFKVGSDEDPDANGA